MRRALAAALAGLSSLLAVAAAWWVLAAPAPPLPQPPRTTLVLDARGGELLTWGPPGSRDSRPLPIERLGPMIVSATLAVEDRRFFQHPGIDPLAMARALWQGLARGRIEGGGSTITQQLVKRGGTPRSLLSKILEMREALALERRFSKTEILEAYLNCLPYGHGLIGPEAASRFHFRKPASELTFAEAIFLAGLPQAPSKYAADPAAAWRRCLRHLRLFGSGSPPAGSLPPPVAHRLGLSARLPAAVSPGRRWIAREAARELKAAGREAFGISTAILPELQAFAEGLANAARASDGAEAAVVVIENSTGFVRACASTIETPPRRSPGSLLKPFVYLRALEKRCLTAATPLEDDPAAPPFPDYQPRNYDARARGRPTVRRALACSLNRPAMRVLAAAGPRECFQRLARWGFASREGFDARGAGFVLGNFEASPIEVAAAYSALARGGEAWAPRWTGGPPSEIRQAGEPAACALVADILADPAARRPSFGSGSPLDLPFRAAVKTGTSSSFRDGWCAGFDGDHTVVVWRGHASGTPLGERLAVQTAAPIWNRIMRFLAGRGSRPLPILVESNALQQHSLPGTGQPEWFLAGTGPPPASPPPAAPQILFPREGMLVELTPGLSPSRQKIIPRSEPPAARWLLNGQPVSEEGIAIEPGTHRLTAEFPGGVAAVSFRVEAPQ